MSRLGGSVYDKKKKERVPKGIPLPRRKSIYEFMINVPYWRDKAWNESNGKKSWQQAG